MARDQAEHLTTLAILVQNGLERRRITRLVIFGIEFASFYLLLFSKAGMCDYENFFVSGSFQQRDSSYIL
jgi:hypothetical protein